jgi:transcriptional regulator with XRE-family HTH domain
MNPADQAASITRLDAERRQELAKFLRARREAISPEEVGLPRQHRRRTPGLRRDEVALLAGIGAAWYSRLEMAHDVKPSVVTLRAIAQALRLNVTETEYLFAIADVAFPRILEPFDIDMPEAIEQLIPAIHNVGALLWDRYLTPLRWNAIADGMFNISRYADPFERNTIIRLCNGHFRDYFGAEYEKARRGAVGMFRRIYVTEEPTAFARRVYETAQGYPFFQASWAEQVIVDDYVANPGPSRRFNSGVGPITITSTTFSVWRHHSLFLRIFAPTGEVTVEKFERLRALGTPSTRETRLP